MRQMHRVFKMRQMLRVLGTFFGGKVGETLKIRILDILRKGAFVAF